MANDSSNSVEKDNIYTLRFSINYLDESSNYNLNEVQEAYNNEIVEKELEHNVYNADFVLLDDNFEQINSIKCSNIPRKLYAVVDFEFGVVQTNFKEEYLNDKNNEKMNIGILAISDNVLMNISHENILIVDTSLKTKMLVEINSNFLHRGTGQFRLFAIAYPYEMPNNKLKSYKMINWENILYTDNIKIDCL